MSVGIDIGSKSIKVVEIAIEAGRAFLKSAGIAGFNLGGIDQLQNDKQYLEVASTIKKLYSDARISSRDVAIAVPESQTFTRTVTFPSLTDQEVASAIKWEAEEYVPIPLNEAIVQHQIIERRDNATPPEVKVLLIAAPKLLIEKYIKILSYAGLNVVGVETELMALVRSLAPPNQTVLLIDFGAKSTDIAIAKNGQLAFSRTIPTAGEAFTRAVAQSLGVQEKQAEEYKRTYGLSASQLEGKIGTALTPIFKIVSEEIKKAIHFYQTDEKGETPNSIILSGGTSGLPDVTPVLTKLIGVEVAIGNPFSKVVVDPNSAKSLQNYAPLYAVAIGLALRGD